MNFYYKGENISESLSRENVPFKNLPDNFVWIEVKPGSKIKNLTTFAEKQIPHVTNTLVWSGYGLGVGKTISCVEIVKRSIKDLHQVTRIGYIVEEENWEPKDPDLDRLMVRRNIPVIHILLTATEVDPTQLGYQGPLKVNETKNPGVSSQSRSNKQNNRKNFRSKNKQKTWQKTTQ